MRSRFSAYAKRDADYLLRTWHSSTRPKVLEFDPDVRWTRLEILGRTGGGPFHTGGTVEFDAHYRMGKRPDVMHETSTFVREDGKWVYLKGS